VSGIAGLWRLDGRPTQPADLDRMLVRLAHRGPDGSGAWRDATIGVGHRMLHTTPESLRERQPLVSASSDLVLTADARIDNRAELCSLLPAPRSLPDADLILAAYERWGETCPEHLLGDFAFAIWDARRQRLFCARDHFGVKPFYYHHRPGRLFAFASEIKGLLALPDAPRRLNETRVADYLVPLLEDKEITFYEEIVRLPPAHWMTVGREGIRRQEYWALDPEREIRLRSDDDYAAAFREIFTEAVRCRLRSAFPVGSMLSGGLDSSSIVCVARKVLAENGGAPLHTFSATFPSLPECDEREYIEGVLDGDGLKPHFIRGDLINPLTEIDRALYHQDEAFYAPNLFLHWGLYDSASQAGVRILLDGFDGDTTVSHGIGYLPELARTGRWITLGREVSCLGRHHKRSALSIFLTRAIRPLAPEVLRRAWRAVTAWRDPYPNPNTIVSLSFAARIGLEQRRSALERGRSRLARAPRTDHWSRLTSGLMPFLLEVADRVAAAFSIDPRYPFFDRRLAEFCLALPPEQKLWKGWGRVVMRRALGELLPPKVQWRPGKCDLSPNFIRGLAAANGGVAELASLEDVCQAVDGFVDRAAVVEAHRRAQATGAEHYALSVWKAVTLALWLHRTGLASQRVPHESLGKRRVQ